MRPGRRTYNRMLFQMDTVLVVNFLRETSPGVVEGDLGLPVRAERAELARALLGVHLRRWLSALSGRYAAYVAHRTRLNRRRIRWAVREWRDQRPSEAMRRLARYADREFALERMGGQIRDPWLAGAVAAAGGAPGVRFATELAEAICREAPAAAEFGQRIEVSLPFLDNREWRSWTTVLSGAQVRAAGGGRIAVQPARREACLASRAGNLMLALHGALAHGPRALEAFTLTYTNRSRLAEAQRAAFLEPLLGAYRFAESAVEGRGELDVEVTLSMAGSTAACWLRAPGENDPHAARVYAAVSCAVQRALRRWLPYTYFAGLDAYDDLATAWPLLAWRCTQPFAGDRIAELTYDIHSPGQMLLARQTTVRGLARELRRAAAILRAAGRYKTASLYVRLDPARVWSSIDAKPTHLNALFRAEQLLVSALVDLGRHARAARDMADTEPAAAVRMLSGFSAQLTHRFEDGLRRLYGRRDCSDFASLVVLEATRALAAALGEPAPVAATLRVNRTAP